MGISNGTRFDTLGPTLTVTTQPAEPAVGDTVTATAVLTNDCPFPLRNAVLHLIDPGATTAAKTIPLGDLRLGAKTTRRWETAMPADVAGNVSFTAHVVFDVDGRSSDCARSAKTFTVPYEPNGVRGPYRVFATADDAEFGQYGSQLVIWAGGRDLSGGADEKGIIHLPGSATESSVVQVKAVSLTGSDNPTAKYGIALANDLAAPEKGGYAVLTMSARFGLEFMTDSDGDGRLDTWAGGGGSAHPSWLRLVRSGTTYTAYSTTNELSWTEVASVTVPSASGAMDAGVVASAVNANYPGTTVRAIFDRFSVEQA
ncbi:hypothetical protein [Streptomyces sp. DSM 40750]|uniref:hypothetical protein n=1 Tax=Streptomyces sp. DSM 40750 TaxID=2801030 RepID=UPI00214C0936|nr:hypothetical protein [Streptomyces sp. DSM 40750]UUU19308.1 hypothetical protein JIX55_02720 [Streptomyces sp. DSM 40750]UUU27349.1 hypothetical protein JIX55_48030 [Streptomyces sp. DSM 40750]